MPKSKEFKPRTTAAEKERRINAIFGLILVGATNAELIRFASDNWDVVSRTTDNYIQEATRRLKEIGKVDRESEFGKALGRLNTLFKSSMKIQDYKTALSVQKEIHKLLSLYLPAQIQVEHTGTVEHEHVAIEQRVQRVNEILETARTRRTEPSLN